MLVLAGSVPPEDDAVWPTHTCFDDALETMIAIYQVAPNPNLLLVHAACTWPDENGELYAHAWLEDVEAQLAYFSGYYKGERMQFMADLKEYREHQRVHFDRKYDYATAWLMNQRHKSFGPWNKELRRLCSTSRKVFNPNAKQT